MARSKNEEPLVNSDNLISDLINGTEFRFIGQDGEEGKGSLTDKPKVETPLLAFNDLIGGGLPLGAILEVYGPNAAGKSSIMYETLGNFQRTYPNGVAFIIDSEASTDDARLRQLGVDPLRAPRMGALTLEDGFEQIVKILKKMTGNPAYKGFPVMILWDTIASVPTRAQIQDGNMYAGGMAEKPRILKTALTNIFPLIEKQNVLLILLNQVMAEIGAWKPGITSAGGNALRHDVHLRLEIDGGKTEYDGVYAVQKFSTLSIAKSKISPIMNDFPIILDITKGGTVDRAGSLVWWVANLTNPNVFKQAAWWELEAWCLNKYRAYWKKFPEISEGKFRQTKLYEVARSNENFVDFLQLIWIDLFSARYELQRAVCKDYRAQIEARLMKNLGLTYDEVYATAEEPVPEEISTEISEETLTDISNILSIDSDTGEVTSE